MGGVGNGTLACRVSDVLFGLEVVIMSGVPEVLTLSVVPFANTG
jgi:hypothetical protein